MTASFRPHRRLWLQAAAALSFGAKLRPAAACEYFCPTLRITHPWARATDETDRSAIVSMRFDEVLQDDRLIGVQTPVAAGAELHGHADAPVVSLPIPRGRETLLGETGSTLRLVGLRHPLLLGRTYPLRLVFEHGGAVDASLDIDYERGS